MRSVQIYFIWTQCNNEGSLSTVRYGKIVTVATVKLISDKIIYQQKNAPKGTNTIRTRIIRWINNIN